MQLVCLSTHHNLSHSQPFPLSLSSPAGVSGRPSFRTIIIISIKAHSPVPGHPCPPAPFTRLIYIYSTAVCLPLFFSFYGFPFQPLSVFLQPIPSLISLGVSFCPTSFYRSLEIIMVGCRLLWAGVLWLKRQLKKDARSNRNHGYLSPK